jgi:hypothetical protein
MIIMNRPISLLEGSLEEVVALFCILLTVGRRRMMQEWLGGGCNNIRSSTTQIISGPPGNNLINCQINGALLSSSLTQSSITHIY